jgi:TM2 domain-containing membrane protein YozV
MSTTKYCSGCGSQIAAAAEICPKCGVRVASPLSPSHAQIKNPGIAAVLSFFFVGLGQIYNGQIGKGVAYMIIGFVCVVIGIATLGVGFILYAIFWIYTIVDAYKSAEKINRRQAKYSYGAVESASSPKQSHTLRNVALAALLILFFVLALMHRL